MMCFYILAASRKTRSVDKKISYKKLWVLLMIDHSQNAREVAASTKRKEKLQKQLKECRDYDEMIAHLALSRIELDLDDGVKVNYRKLQTAGDGKFYEVLADSKNIMAKEK